MRYNPISKDFYIEARQRFTRQMKAGSLAVFCSNDIYPTSADGHMPFKQATDIFHLCGVDQEETVLVLFPDSFHPNHREVLFVKETSETIAIWEGAKLSKEEARNNTGIQTIYWLSDLERVLNTLMSEAKTVYLNSNEHTRATVEVETREMRFSKWLRNKYPHHQIERSAPLMHRIRAVKSPAEIAQLQKAIDITRDGFNRVMKFVKPGVMEYEIEAEYLHEFIRQGSRGFAYTPIIASGYSACVLHYIDNDKPCKDGDLLLMDVGAEYGNYNADMTRCIPVSGRFTKRQRDVYNAVLRVMKGAKAMLKPGVLLHEYHRAVGELMTKELVDLRLITTDDVRNQNPEWPAYKKYFMHGTSHFLGLDVHDVGDWTQPVAEGNVFTVEPGIYIREESLGIRIENNIVITAGGNEDMFSAFAIEAEEIETIMNS
jgi:Xaa-Pro aminopeptidase